MPGPRSQGLPSPTVCAGIVVTMLAMIVLPAAITLHTVHVPMPPGLAPAIVPLLEQVNGLTEQIRQMDKQIGAMGKRYPEVVRLRSAPGVGHVIAAAYVLTLDSPEMVRESRAVGGAFPGLRPRQSQSADCDPQLRISKTGSD